jgi:DNA invertase Pin-like site-specific DNA recombinase
MARVAIYLRVSTKEQTTAIQRIALETWAANADHTVVAVYEDAAVSGGKTSGQRPQMAAMLKAAVRREFDLVAVWAIDRLGRSLSDLLATLATFQSTKTNLFVHQQAIDTQTPAGKALFGMCGVFAEFERSLITERVNAGVQRCKLARANGKIITKTGRWFGRQPVSQAKINATRDALGQPGASVRKVAAMVGLSVGKVSAIRRATVAEVQAASTV